MTTRNTRKGGKKKNATAGRPSLRETPVEERIVEAARDRASKRRSDGVKSGKPMRRARPATGFVGD